MALKANEFDGVLRKLFDTLGEIELLCRTIHTQVGNAASVARRALEKGRAAGASSGKPASKHIGTTTALTVPVLFKQNHHACHTRFKAGTMKRCSNSSPSWTTASRPSA